MWKCVYFSHKHLVGCPDRPAHMNIWEFSKSMGLKKYQRVGLLFLNLTQKLVWEENNTDAETNTAETPNSLLEKDQSANTEQR